MIVQSIGNRWSTLLTPLLTTISCWVQRNGKWTFLRSVSNPAQNRGSGPVMIGGDVNSGLSSSALRPFSPDYASPLTHKRKSGGVLMEPGSFRNRLRRSLVPFWNFLTKLFAVPARPPTGYGTQGVCPFCGRITPRSQRLCLECGKPLRGIQMPPKDARQG